MQEVASSGSKCLRIVGESTRSQQSDGRTHIDINDEAMDVEDEQTLRLRYEEIK